MGEKYSKNLGDGVICRCVEGLVRKYAHANDVVVSLDLSCRRDYNRKYAVTEGKFARIIGKFTDRFLSLRVIQRRIKKRMSKGAYMYWTWERHDKKIVKALCKENPADCVIFAGGELFKDYFLWYIQYFVEEYGKRGSRICFNACGCDVNNTPFVTQKFQKVLGHRCVKRVTTRSLPETCSQLINPEQYCFMPDPAICAADFFQASEKMGCIGLGIMCLDGIHKNKNRLLDFWGNIIAQLETQNFAFKLFCNGDLGDYRFAEELVEHFGLPKDVLLPAPQTPEELVSLITGFDRICSFRMHSLIIAYAFGIPFVGLGWDKKLYDFAEYIHAKGQICNWEKDSPEAVLSKMFHFSIDLSKQSTLKNAIHYEIKTAISERTL